MLMRACRAVTAIVAGCVLVHMAIMLHRRSHAAYQCEMTYMHPSYERMDVDSKLSWRYGLFLYRDTEAAAPPHGMHLNLLQHAMLINEHERARTLLQPLTRHVVVLAADERRQVPVLFLPGNGGNHQQVMAVISGPVMKTACAVDKADGRGRTRWSGAVAGVRGGTASAADTAGLGPAVVCCGFQGGALSPRWRPAGETDTALLHLGAEASLAACVLDSLRHKHRHRAGNMPMQEHQTTFAVDCLRWLCSRHAVHGSSTDTPHVIVVGHSMGGIVGRAAMAHLTAGHTSGALVPRSVCSKQRSARPLHVRKTQRYVVQKDHHCSRW
jgi:pimeloyl-ACP methyl ester carboxylesterase